MLPSTLCCHIFSTGSFCGIILRDPLMTDQHQNFSEGALGVNISKFEGGGRRRNAISGQFFKSAQNVIFGLFFLSLEYFWRDRKLKLVDLEKKIDKIS